AGWDRGPFGVETGAGHEDEPSLLVADLVPLREGRAAIPVTGGVDGVVGDEPIGTDDHHASGEVTVRRDPGTVRGPDDDVEVEELAGALGAIPHQEALVSV